MAIKNMNRDCALLSQRRCLNCTKNFEESNKIYQRFSLLTKLDENTTVLDVVEDYFSYLGFVIAAPKVTYLCYECVSLVKKWNRGILREKKFKHRTRQRRPNINIEDMEDASDRSTIQATKIKIDGQFSEKEVDEVWVMVFQSLYGTSTYKQWSLIKVMMGFESEHEYVEWLMKCASRECSLAESEAEMNRPTTTTSQKLKSPRISSESRLWNEYHISPTRIAPSNKQEYLKDCKLTGSGECDYRPEIPAASRLAKRKCKHLGKKRHLCDICDYCTANAGNLAKHKRTHTGEKPYLCDICDYRAAQRSTLVGHKLTHTGERPYACDKCDYRAARATHVATHKLIHTGEQKKTYMCDECGYGTAYANALIVHKRKHTGEKPYNCEMCDFRTARAGALVIHKRTHTAEKPYVCDECGYRSIEVGNLAKHKRRRKHTGQKPIFACDTCDYWTASAGCLVTHKLTHTGEKTSAAWARKSTNQT